MQELLQKMKQKMAALEIAPRDLLLNKEMIELCEQRRVETDQLVERLRAETNETAINCLAALTMYGWDVSKATEFLTRPRF